MATLAPRPRAVVVEERENPSTDYYVLPLLRERGFAVERMGFADPPAPESLSGALVVFVRWLPRRWISVVEQARTWLSGLVYFMDDDLLDPAAARCTPAPYRLKLHRLILGRRSTLERLSPTVWVSTQALAEKYARLSPLVVPPRDVDRGAPSRIVFYHGTISHFAEARWLVPVADALVQRDSSVGVEIVGGAVTSFLYRRTPRVWVTAPMRWPAYQRFLGLTGRQVGLAPQLNTVFNRGRSHTKFFDFTRAGAVGVYAENSAYAEVVEHGVDGLLVPMRRAAFIEAALKLLADDELRAAMHAKAKSKAARLGAAR